MSAIATASSSTATTKTMMEEKRHAHLRHQPRKATSRRSIELPSHPYFVACQFHPEFLSKPNESHPIFRGFVKAALAHHGLPEVHC
jgi:CTP synthase (UTP-ammonia lyase)